MFLNSKITRGRRLYGLVISILVILHIRSRQEFKWFVWLIVTSFSPWSPATDDPIWREYSSFVSAINAFSKALSYSSISSWFMRLPIQSGVWEVGWIWSIQLLRLCLIIEHRTSMFIFYSETSTEPWSNLGFGGSTSLLNWWNSSPHYLHNAH